MLNYLIPTDLKHISLDLWEAEFYHSAVVVQPLIGNLVYHSNHGRYEPRLAKKWSRVSPTRWEFTLIRGMTCENGEPITPESFKQSIERSIRAGLKTGEPPVFNKLLGYREFLNGHSTLDGIQIEGDKIVFEFHSPLRDGVVQALSLAPYGYICAENMNLDGTWKDKYRFISSGPYKVSRVEPGKFFELELRDQWKDSSNKAAPSKVLIEKYVPSEVPLSKWQIIDTFESPKLVPQTFKKYNLVPEYLVGIVFGNLKNGFFSKIENRKKFKQTLEVFRDEILPPQFGFQIRTNSFFAVSPNSVEKQTTMPIYESKHGNGNLTLIIEGNEPDEKSHRYASWQVLKRALDHAGLTYRFANNETNWHTWSSRDYDLRIIGTSIGGSASPLSIEFVFCSIIGSQLPDPSGRVCGLLDDFAKEKVELLEFEKKFLEIVDDDAAIVPISHFGVQLFLSPSINPKSLSPALNVIRFDQLEME